VHNFLRSVPIRGLTLVLVAALGAGAGAAPGLSERANLLLIVADDLGYTDLGVYGGDIRTPNIDALAREGTLFSQFHTAPMCAPTRAMLLSGNNNHVAGMANQQRVGLLGHPFPGYEAGLSERVAALPRLLAAAGYQTYAVGKWHLGFTEAQSPTAAGFQRSWMMLDGAGTHYDGIGFENGPSTFWADGAPATYPEGTYATQWYTDRLIAFLEAGRGTGAPFFAYAAYTAPHWPLQVPAAHRNAYAGRYDAGYDALRLERFDAARRVGVIPQDSTLPQRNPAVAPWKSLSPEQQRREARKMELYAAMVERLDHHIGRLLTYLREIGELENTLVVFMSDNGAAAEDFYNVGPFREYLQRHFTNAYDAMGSPRSFVSYGAPWAEASSAPFSRHKTFAREGGIVAPLIIAGPGVSAERPIDRAYVTAMDIAPTFLDVAGVPYPGADGLRPPEGTSLRPRLNGSTAPPHPDTDVTALYHRGVALLRQGPWKLVTLEAPFDERRFELFNLEADPGETRDLAAQYPEKYRELIALWRRERRRLGIVLPQDL